MQVTLIRHSMTAGNAALQYIGRTNEPLSDDGIEMAKKMGGNLGVRTVYVSTLLRTQQTAAILFPDACQIVVDGLQEMDFGDFEGRSFKDMAEDKAYCTWVESNCLTACPNGESRAEFSSRVCSAFTKVIANAAAQGEDAVVFVVHGGTIMAIMERFAQPSREYYSWSVKNCQGYRCRVDFSVIDKTFTLVELTAWEGTF